MRASTAVALGIAAYLVFLAATIPAAFVARRIDASAVRAGEARGTPSNASAVHVSEARGTVWNGSARLELALPSGPLTVEELAWHFLPARLLTGRVAFAVHVRSPGEGALEIARGFGGWEMRGLAWKGDAAALAALSPLVATWRPQGQVAITAPHLAWNGREARGSARLEWHDAAVALADVHPLGTYRVDVEAAGGPAKIALSTVDGVLQAKGNGTVDANGRITFSGEALATGPQASALEPLLDLLGRRRPDGAHALDWRAP
jgi:general secretion pathway protein N